MLYSFAFFDDFILIYPLYAVMFADRGLNGAQISSLFIVWSLVAFVLEVPSGAIADKYSRKHVLIVAQLFRIIGYGFWLFMPSYIGFLIGFVLWGIKSALTSGTVEALVYDELTKLGQKDKYTKLLGRMHGLSLLGIALASFGASRVVSLGYGAILLASMAGVALAAAAVALLPSATIVRSVVDKKYLTYLKDGIRAVSHQGSVLLIVLCLAVALGFTGIDEYFGLFFREKGFSNSNLSLLIGAVYIFGIAGSFVAHRFGKRTISYSWLFLLWGILLAAAVIAPGLMAPLAIGSFVFFGYVIELSFNTHLQRAIPDHVRATVTSVGGLFSEIVALLVFGVFALSSGKLNYSGSLMLIAILILTITIGLVFGGLMLKRRGTLKPFSGPWLRI